MNTPRDDQQDPGAADAGSAGGGVVPGAGDAPPRDDALSALFRQLPPSVPSAQTDAAILAAARRAAGARPRSIVRWQRWSVPVAAAASVMLVVTVLHRQEGPELAPQAVLDMPSPVEAAPAPVPEALAEATPEAEPEAVPETVVVSGIAAVPAPAAVAAQAGSAAVAGETALAADESLAVRGGVVARAEPPSPPALPPPPPLAAALPAEDIAGAGRLQERWQARQRELAGQRVELQRVEAARKSAVAASGEGPALAADETVVVQESIAATAAGPSPAAGVSRYFAGMTVLSAREEAAGARTWQLLAPDTGVLRARLRADGWQEHAACAAWPGGVLARGDEQVAWTLPDAGGSITLRAGPVVCPP